MFPSIFPIQISDKVLQIISLNSFVYFSLIIFSNYIVGNFSVLVRFKWTILKVSIFLTLHDFINIHTIFVNCKIKIIIINTHYLSHLEYCRLWMKWKICSVTMHHEGTIPKISLLKYKRTSTLSFWPLVELTFLLT